MMTSRNNQKETAKCELQNQRNESLPSQWNATYAFLACVAVTCVKILLIPSYRSTDFEVHRNWMAITFSLPLKEWYFENTSEWTLDYPPLFAYFERILAQCAYFVDPNMLQINNLNYHSLETVYFMRSSVIITDILYIWTCWKYVSFTKMSGTAKLVTFVLAIFNAGLLFVDHIHFQYNGVLMGLLIGCIYFSVTDQPILAAISFSTLVLMKHLFVTLAPIIGIFLLKSCWVLPNSSASSNGQDAGRFSLTRLFGLIGTAVVFLGIAFAPFMIPSYGGLRLQFPQIVSRLFPFGRGLVHAYWAPNIWALYCFFDKVVVLVLGKLNYLPESNTSGYSSTAGLVGDFYFGILPRISAQICLFLYFVSIVPAVVGLMRENSANRWIRSQRLVAALVYASLSSFMWGYHVHEKAIIIPIVLQTLLALEPSRPFKRVSSHNTAEKASDSGLQQIISRSLFGLLGIVGTYSLFPLFYTLPELITKATVFSCYAASVIYSISQYDTPSESQEISRDSQQTPRALSWLLNSALVILAVLFVFSEVAHPLVFYDPISKSFMYPFLPRLMTSVVCALYLALAYLLSAWQMWIVLFNDTE